MTPSDFDLNQIRAKVKAGMRKATPRDTGNLAFNALYGYKTKDGLRMTYRGSIAGYGKILNQSVMLGTKKNKHFGWHSRASTNAIAVVVREFNPKAKGFRMHNNRQASFKERVAATEEAFNKIDKKDDKFTSGTKKYLKDIKQEQIEQTLRRQDKWKMNSAKKKFESINTVV